MQFLSLSLSLSLPLSFLERHPPFFLISPLFVFQLSLLLPALSSARFLFALSAFTIPSFYYFLVYRSSAHIILQCRNFSQYLPFDKYDESSKRVLLKPRIQGFLNVLFFFFFFFFFEKRFQTLCQSVDRCTNYTNLLSREEIQQARGDAAHSVHATFLLAPLACLVNKFLRRHVPRPEPWNKDIIPG